MKDDNELPLEQTSKNPNEAFENYQQELREANAIKRPHVAVEIEERKTPQFEKTSLGFKEKQAWFRDLSRSFIVSVKKTKEGILIKRRLITRYNNEFKSGPRSGSFQYLKM